MDQIVKQDSFTHLIAGASKRIGRVAFEFFVDKGEQVIALSRSQPDPLPSGCQWLTADARQPESFADELPEVIHRLTFCPGKVILGPPSDQSRTSDGSLSDERGRCLRAHSSLAAQAYRQFDRTHFLGGRQHRPPESLALISAAKAGLEGLALALAADLAPKTVNNGLFYSDPDRDGARHGRGRKDDSDDRKPASPQKATLP